MPWSSKQLKLFRAAAHNPAISKSSGIKQADAERMSKEGLKKASGGRIPVNGSDSVMHMEQGPTKMSVNRAKLIRRPTASLPYTDTSKYRGMAEGGSVAMPWQQRAEQILGQPLPQSV